ALAEGRDDLLELARAQDAVVDEDAGESIAEGLVADHCGDRGVHAAREPADPGLVRTDPPLHVADPVVSERTRRPGRSDARDVEQERGEDLGAARGVYDLGMELDAVDLALRVVDRTKLGVRRDADRREARGHRRDPVAVAHPNVERLALGEA